MPDEQAPPAPVPLTTTGNLAVLATEALVSSVGTAKLAGLVTEALVSGVATALPPSQTAVTVNTG